MPFFSQKEKRKHYNAVAKGEKPVKSNSKFNKKEQIAYAKGQRDARISIVQTNSVQLIKRSRRNGASSILKVKRIMGV